MIGIATWALEAESLDCKLQMLADMGYNAASVLGNFLDAIALDDLSALERTLADRDMVLTVHSGFRSPQREVNEEASLAQARRILDWHAKTGRVACLSYDVPWLETSPGVHRTDPRSILGTFRKVLALSSNCGLRVVLEDCPLDREQSRQFEGWSRRFPHSGILVDLGHMNMRLREPKHDVQPLRPGAVENYLRGIPAEIVELHVHGNDGSEDQHLPPYEGNANLDAAAETLKEIGFQGISTIEFARAWCQADQGQLAEAAEKSLVFWKSLLLS